mgnify:CR=1 FL=1
MKLSARVLLVMVTLVLLTVGAIGVVLYTNLVPRIIDSDSILALDQTTKLSQSFTSDIRQAEHDVTAAQSLPIVQEIADGEVSGPDWKAILGEYFAAQLKAKPDYLQFRLIGVGDDGRELVRAERDIENDSVRIIPQAELQTKEDSKYFTEALSLSPDDVYISDIELNREYGAVQVPHIPVIRIAKSVRTTDGTEFGFLIINVDMRSVFARLQEDARADSNLYVVNEYGNYLLHPDQTRTFGFDLGHDFNLNYDFPSLAWPLTSDSSVELDVADKLGELFVIAAASVAPAGQRRAVIIQTIPIYTFYGNLVAAGKSTGIVVLTIIAFAIALAVFLAGSLAKPMRVMTDAAKALTEGKRLPLPVNAQGEIGILARTFERMANDIQEKTAELADANKDLTEKTQRYHKLLNELSVGFVVSDAKGRILEANAPYGRMAGQDVPWEMIGRNLTDFIAPNEHEITKRIASETSKNAVVSAMATHVWPSGERRAIRVNTIEERSDTGDLLYISLCHDVTEQLETERRLKEANSIYESMFDSSEVAIIDMDYSGIFNLVHKVQNIGYANLRDYVSESDARAAEVIDLAQVNRMNTAALTMFGRQSDQTVERIVDASKDVALAWSLDIADAIASGQKRMRKETEFIAADGTRIPGLMSLLIPASSEEAKRVPIMMFDISDLKLAEAARQATAAKSDFLTSMSHEIRTPLNSIIGNLELLALTHVDNDQTEFIESAANASKVLLALIGNILDFSKIESGKLTIEISDFDPAEVMTTAVDVLQSIARQKGSFVTAVYADNLPRLVRGDKARVRQILLNLIGNAVNFTNQGGVQVRLTAHTRADGEHMLRYEIHDSGSGFAPEIAPEIFKPFVQGNRNRDFIKGTGLGLSICKTLVETFGGSIGCEGVPEEGASFWFEFPAPIVIPTQPTSQADLSGSKILLIGEEQKVSAVENYFKARNAEVIRANTAEEGREKARQAVIDEHPIQLCVVHFRDDDENWAELTNDLKNLEIVSICFFTGQKRNWHRRALRQGFSFLFNQVMLGSDMDRNIKLILGQASTVEAPASKLLDFVEAHTQLKGKNILVLEDSVINQTIISRQLRTFDLEFFVAPDGSKGLDAMQRQDFDCVLCDCSMPVMSGFEFTRAVRTREAQENKGHHLPIIALTANAFRDDEDKCRAAGMDDFISKPATLARLTHVLMKWCGQSNNEPSTRIIVEQPSAPAVDLNALTKILGVEDPALQNELLAEFVPTALASLETISKALEENDQAQAKAAAHKAKGDARSMGATSLGEIYAALEVAVKDNDQQKINELRSHAALAVQAIEEFVTEHVRQQG